MVNILILAFALTVHDVHVPLNATTVKAEAAAAAPAAPARIVEPDQQSSAEIKRIEDVARALIAADNDRDVERVVGLYAPDAMLLPPDEPPVEGISAIRPRYEAFFRTHHPAILITIEETVVADNLAYVRGRTGGSIRGLGGVADRSLNDVFMMILRRTEVGDWRISRLMWHSAGDPGAR